MNFPLKILKINELDIVYLVFVMVHILQLGILMRIVLAMEYMLHCR